MQLYVDQLKARAEEKQKLVAKDGGANYGTLLPTLDTQWTSTKIELVMFFFLVSTKLSDQVITNLLESRECLVNQRLDTANCTEPLSERVEGLVQPGTANIITAKTLVESFIPSFFALLVGPWSDQNGRKPFLTITIAGNAIAFFIWAVLSLLPRLGPQVFLLASVPIALSGGSFFLLCFCYISDVTDINNRARRLAYISLVNIASTIVGSSCGPLLLSVQNSINPYPPIFFLSACLLLLTALYTHYYLRETIIIHPTRERRLLVFTHVKKLFSTCFEQRANHGRTIIHLLVWTLTVIVCTVEGEGANIYLSVREMFSWQLSDYTVFQCFVSVISGVGALAGVTVLVSWLGLSNMAAAIVVLCLKIIHYIMKALATTGSIFYWASLVNVFSSTITIFFRTQLSLLVPSEDLGKVFALTAFQESIIPMITTPIYTIVYKATFLTSPGTIYWLSAALSVLSVVMLLIAIILHKNGREMLDNNKL